MQQWWSSTSLQNNNVQKPYNSIWKRAKMPVVSKMRLKVRKQDICARNPPALNNSNTMSNTINNSLNLADSSLHSPKWLSNQMQTKPGYLSAKLN